MVRAVIEAHFSPESFFSRTARKSNMGKNYSAHGQILGISNDLGSTVTHADNESLSGFESIAEISLLRSSVKNQCSRDGKNIFIVAG